MYAYLKDSPWVNSIVLTEGNQKGGFDDDTLDWGVDVVNGEQAWGGIEDATNISATPKATGDGIRVGILDTGIDYDHEEFNSQTIDGWNCIDNNTNFNDVEGHGTAMAGMEINVTIVDGTGSILATQTGFTDAFGFFNLTFIVGDWPDNTEVWVYFFPEDPINFGIPDGYYILTVQLEFFRAP